MTYLVKTRGCPAKVVHGAARGADALADAWGYTMAVPVERVPADWKANGRAAGPIRNQKMLDEHKPTVVIAFPGGRGTADMVARSKKLSEIVVIEIKLKMEGSDAN